MIKGFNEKYDTIIFDMDGVITSEEHYWNAAALTVYEKVNGICGADVRKLTEEVADVRKHVFCNNKLITVLKNRGVNSNWDLGYVTIMIAKILGTDNYAEVLSYAERMSDDILVEYKRLSDETSAVCDDEVGFYDRNGGWWCELRDCFQEWYLGSDGFYATFGVEPKVAGKPGLIASEKPLFEVDELRLLLSGLHRTHRLCIGTGRPSSEIIPQLEMWGLIDFFDANGLANYDYVVAAERSSGMTLTKPHPYLFLKALYGSDYPDSDIINGNYDRARIERTLVVGDAGADILAARAMGADFCAVLTGVNGEKARGYFEKLNAEYILDNVCDMV